jgi:hypothetical protein
MAVNELNKEKDDCYNIIQNLQAKLKVADEGLAEKNKELAKKDADIRMLNKKLEMIVNVNELKLADNQMNMSFIEGKLAKDLESINDLKLSRDELIKQSALDLNELKSNNGKKNESVIFTMSADISHNNC